jgi:hypothetical protein
MQNIKTKNQDMELKQQIEELQSRYQELKEKFIKLESNKTTYNTTTNTQNIYIQNNKVIKSFGDEDLSHLTNDFLSHCLLNPSKGLSNLIETIHYNKEKPCNLNIRYKSFKQNLYEKFTNSEWRECDATNTLDELIRKGYRILNAHYAEYFMNDPDIYADEMKRRIYERFRFLSDKQSNEYFAVKRELRALVKDRTLYFLESPKGIEQIEAISK